MTRTFLYAYFMQQPPLCSVSVAKRGKSLTPKGKRGGWSESPWIDISRNTSSLPAAEAFLFIFAHGMQCLPASPLRRGAFSELFRCTHRVKEKASKADDWGDWVRVRVDEEITDPDIVHFCFLCAEVFRSVPKCSSALVPV
jgi:hypothetical protein